MSAIPDIMLPRFLEKGKASSVAMPLYTLKGTLVAPSGATYSLLDANNTPVLDEVACTITSGFATYAILSTFADSYDLPQATWLERWTFTGITGQKPVENTVFLCRYAPVMSITAEHLFKMHPLWRTQLPKARADYSEPIMLAWEELINNMLNDGVLPHKLMDRSRLAMPHKFLAASIVASDFWSDNPDDVVMKEKAAEYRKMYENLYNKLATRRDNDEDGISDSDSAVYMEPQLFLTDIPQYRRFPVSSSGDE